ncbi:uncharacterized protein LOC108461683 isoform X2 [Gossypium arboreum]|uniref:uncharacterized protein LOC108461683 isoform X2 n=1 Tax=Gossypium arboreum TaxID=29729 RepID=UPI0022F19D81|nr:uncharacterized protein LOC108461683 isoform X2 [Gossypium arboreum]
MVKSKQRQLGLKHSNKKNARGGRLGFSYPNFELDLLGEDGWVVVKKQRVTILIPPLPSSKKSKMANQGPGQLQGQKKEDVQKFPKSTPLAHKMGMEIARQQISTSPTFPALGPGVEEPKKPGSMILNRRLRVSNLERKLQQAGGLTRWLKSLGLDQFVRIFQAKSINKFQLVNLNMQKLKDMGADAVGPRRKLIHAIDCVCQPLCFKA